ncbi:MAG: Piwi domain-containing protein [Acidobacteriota bacterium]
MELPSTIRLNFLSLTSPDFMLRVFRRSVPPNAQKLDKEFYYTLPTARNLDQRANYAISFTPQPEFEEWEFTPTQNRQLALRALHHLLLEQTKTLTGGNEIPHSSPDKFARRIYYTIKTTPLGDQQVTIEPFYLHATQEIGFLIDFSFHNKSIDRCSREAQRLSLSLDSQFRSNKNAYIDRETIVAEFIRDQGRQLFPITNVYLKFPLTITSQFARIATQQLIEKQFVLGNNSIHGSAWKGLEQAGPLEPPPTKEYGFIIIYRNDHRPLAEDLYRALMGKSQNVAFSGLSSVFKLDIAKFQGISVSAWTREELDRALSETAATIVEHPETTYLALMIEDKTNEALYFAAKYFCIQKEIPLQVVSAQLIQQREQFKWSVSNIALQIFTKLGGKPWKVVPAHDKCLIIGIGQAHRTGIEGIQKYFAYCVATDSSGIYKKIAVLSNTNSHSNYLSDLRQSLVKELTVAAPGQYQHCVIHIPFKIKKEELAAIEEAIAAATERQQGIAFCVIKINEHHKFFGYARNNSRVPREGTIARLSHSEVLLWFEGLRHDRDVIRKRTANPAHLEFLWPHPPPADCDQTLYLQDLFNLSGTNWRGFNALSTPISTYYCKLIARFLAQFPSELQKIEATTEPWFL